MKTEPINKQSLLELDKMWASARARVTGLMHGKIVARRREEFLQAMIEMWPAIREHISNTESRLECLIHGGP